MWCVSGLKNDFVVLDADLLSKFPQNWRFVSKLENMMQYQMDGPFLIISDSIDFFFYCIKNELNSYTYFVGKIY